MANVELNRILDAINGRLGNVVFKKLGNRVYISRRPDFSRRELSAAQKESVERFRAAVKQAKKTIADPQLRAPFELEAKRQGKTVYHTIIGEYMSERK